MFFGVTNAITIPQNLKAAAGSIDQIKTTNRDIKLPKLLHDGANQRSREPVLSKIQWLKVNPRNNTFKKHDL